MIYIELVIFNNHDCIKQLSTASTPYTVVRFGFSFVLLIIKVLSVELKYEILLQPETAKSSPWDRRT